MVFLNVGLCTFRHVISFYRFKGRGWTKLNFWYLGHCFFFLIIIIIIVFSSDIRIIEMVRYPRDVYCSEGFMRV